MIIFNTIVDLDLNGNELVGISVSVDGQTPRPVSDFSPQTNTCTVANLTRGKSHAIKMVPVAKHYSLSSKHGPLGTRVFTLKNKVVSAVC